MLGFYVKSSDPDAAKKVMKSFKVISHAASLGGVHSLCEMPILMSAAPHPPEMHKRLGIDHSYIRLSVGLESIDDLLNDLNQALDQVKL
jgi:cystathionine beta-lyase/cystathionine gamma-synthase